VRLATAALAISLALAGTAFAQVPGSRSSNQGSFAVDAMVAPTTGFGFGYYLTDGLSLRPWLGLGYADAGGFFANVGAQLQYEFGTDWKVSPYLSASGLYSHNPSYGYAPQQGRPGAPGAQQVGYSADGGQFGAGAGLRFRVASSFSLFAEGRALYTTYSMGSLQQQGWGSFGMGDHTHGEFVLGLSYLFH
jgi:hypothetical protein